MAQFFEEVEADAFADDDASGKSDYRELLTFAKSPVGQRVCRAFLKIHKKETQRTLLRMIETLSEEEP